jgi:hypothetical protein
VYVKDSVSILVKMYEVYDTRLGSVVASFVILRNAHRYGVTTGRLLIIVMHLGENIGTYQVDIVVTFLTGIQEVLRSNVSWVPTILMEVFNGSSQSFRQRPG